MQVRSPAKGSCKSRRSSGLARCAVICSVNDRGCRGLGILWVLIVDALLGRARFCDALLGRAVSPTCAVNLASCAYVFASLLFIV